MGQIATAFANCFRDFLTDGVALSGVWKVLKSDCRALGATIEAYVGGGNGGQIYADGQALAVGNRYGVNTSVGAFGGNLPSIATVSPNDSLRLTDLDFHAATNPYTIHANGSDTIVFEDQAAASSLAMNLNGVTVELVANIQGETAYWRAFFYGA